MTEGQKARAQGRWPERRWQLMLRDWRAGALRLVVRASRVVMPVEMTLRVRRDGRVSGVVR